MSKKNNNKNAIEEKDLDIEELKYNNARCIQSTTTSSYMYRDRIVNISNECTYLHYLTKENFTRNIRSTYEVDTSEFTHLELMVIFTNIDYTIEIIKRRILNIFDKSEYDGVEENFEVIYDKANKLFKIILDYQIMERFAPDFKNAFIVEIIIGTLVAIAEELKDSLDQSSIKVINNELIINNAVKI